MNNLFKKYGYMFWVVFTILLLVACGNDDMRILQTKKFAVNIPNSWLVKKEGENKVLFIMPEVRNEEISISIFANPINRKMSLDEAWEKMKKVIINEDDIVIDEGKDIISNITWKKFVLKKVICDIEMKKIVLFSQNNSTNYLIQFDCPKDKYDKVLLIFLSTMKSFRQIGK